MSAKGVKVVAVLGPTCTGKSDLALWLAPEVGGEIVNADSMQVYRHFDIGSAKPDAAVRAHIPHHVIDVAEPGEEFNAAAFQRLADRAIREISSRGRLPLVVGGTGLYLRVLFHGLFRVGSDPGLRERLRRRYLENPDLVYGELREKDPEYALTISPRDGVRVVRGLEIYSLSGVPMSRWRNRHGFHEKRYEACKIGLTAERRVLYARIDRRVEEMLARGWVEEVEGLLKLYPREAKPFHAIGYREIVRYLAREIPYPEMVGRIKVATRHYGKRQLTWFSREKEIEWHTYPEERDMILERIRSFLR
jgi:tRNA dimethylallyltransferase